MKNNLEISTANIGTTKNVNNSKLNKNKSSNEETSSSQNSQKKHSPESNKTTPKKSNNTETCSSNTKKQSPDSVKTIVSSTTPNNHSRQRMTIQNITPSNTPQGLSDTGIKQRVAHTPKTSQGMLGLINDNSVQIRYVRTELEWN